MLHLNRLTGTYAYRHANYALAPSLFYAPSIPCSFVALPARPVSPQIWDSIHRSWYGWKQPSTVSTIMGYSNTGTSPKIVVEYEHVWDATKKHHGIWWDKVLSHTRFFLSQQMCKTAMWLIRDVSSSNHGRLTNNDGKTPLRIISNRTISNIFGPVNKVIQSVPFYNATLW